MKTALLLWQAITPVHPGTGQDSANVIDLPVAREAGTMFPMIPASSVKGVFRDGVGLRDGDETSTDPAVQRARNRFGYADRQQQDGKAQSGVGELTFTDSRLLCLPVPSFRGTFALVTCPLVLQRLSRDRELLGFEPLTLPESAPDSSPPTALVGEGTLLTHGELVILNDLDFTARTDPTLADLCAQLVGEDPAQLNPMRRRICVVPDDVFSFLCATALEITAHVRLEPKTKTVAKGALWYEECLPAESLLTSFLMGKDDLEVIGERTWYQIGGKSTVGRGLMKLATVAEVAS